MLRTANPAGQSSSPATYSVARRGSSAIVAIVASPAAEIAIAGPNHSAWAEMVRPAQTKPLSRSRPSPAALEDQHWLAEHRQIPCAVGVLVHLTEQLRCAVRNDADPKFGASNGLYVARSACI